MPRQPFAEPPVPALLAALLVTIAPAECADGVPAICATSPVIQRSGPAVIYGENFDDEALMVGTKVLSSDSTDDSLRQSLEAAMRGNILPKEIGEPDRGGRGVKEPHGQSLRTISMRVMRKPHRTASIFGKRHRVLALLMSRGSSAHVLSGSRTRNRVYLGTI